MSSFAYTPEMMSAFANAFGHAPPKDYVPPVLSHKVRKALHNMLWTELHYSDFSKGDECGAKLGTELKLRKMDESKGGTTTDSPITSNEYALLGSVFHLAIEKWIDMKGGDPTAFSTLGHDPWFWQELFKEVMLNPRRRRYIYFHNGQPLRWGDDIVKQWCAMFATQQTWGISAANLIHRTLQRIEASGWTVLHVEYRMKYIDGKDEGYPVVWDGMIDIVAVNIRGEVGIFDVKTAGMWAAFATAGTSWARGASIKKQIWSPIQIQFHAQLRHYHWLYEAITKTKVSYYGLIFPANLVPYAKSGKDSKGNTYSAGDDRGPVMQAQPVLTSAWGVMYRNDLVDKVSRWALHGFSRNMPTDWGVPKCPECPYFKHCVGAPNASISGAQAEFLKQYRADRNNNQDGETDE
jgi:hypothetical protein